MNWSEVLGMVIVTVNLWLRRNIYLNEGSSMRYLHLSPHLLPSFSISTPVRHPRWSCENFVSLHLERYLYRWSWNETRQNCTFLIGCVHRITRTAAFGRKYQNNFLILEEGALGRVGGQNFAPSTANALKLWSLLGYRHASLRGISFHMALDAWV